MRAHGAATLRRGAHLGQQLLPRHVTFPCLGNARMKCVLLQSQQGHSPGISAVLYSRQRLYLASIYSVNSAPQAPLPRTHEGRPEPWTYTVPLPTRRASSATHLELRHGAQDRVTPGPPHCARSRRMHGTARFPVDFLAPAKRLGALPRCDDATSVRFRNFMIWLQLNLQFIWRSCPAGRHPVHH